MFLFTKFYSLNVDTSPWGGEGWVVLQDQAAQGCDISVITTRDGVVRGNIYSNVYSLANGHKLPTGTYKMNVMNYLQCIAYSKGFILLSQWRIAGSFYGLP